MTRRLLAPLLLITASFPVHGAQFLIVSRNSTGAFTLTEADEIVVNGKSKVRVATTPAESWDSKSIGRLADEPLANFPLVVRSSAGTLHARAADGASWTLLLPDASNAKTAASVAELWR